MDRGGRQECGGLKVDGGDREGKEWRETIGGKVRKMEERQRLVRYT